MKQPRRDPKPFPHLCPECCKQSVFPKTIENYIFQWQYKGKLRDIPVKNLVIHQCSDCQCYLIPNDSLNKIEEEIEKFKKEYSE